MPVRARELRRGRRRGRGRRADGEDPPGPRSLPAAPARDPDDRQVGRHDLVRGALRARSHGQRDRLGAALQLGQRRRHLHLHLHVRDHRAAEGLRDLARQLPRDARDGALGQRPRGRRDHLPVPAAGTLVRAADPVRHLRPRGDARLLGARPAEDPPQPLRGQAHLLPLGAADLREDLHRRDRRGREGGRAEEVGLRLGDRGRQEGPAARARGPQPGTAARPTTPDRRQAGAVEDPGPVRRQPEARGHRRGADQPGDPRVLRRLRRPHPRGLGDDGDLDRGDHRHPGGLQVRDDRQAVPGDRGEDRRGRRDPGQGPERVPGLLQEPARRPRRRWSTDGCTRATSASTTPTAT